MARTLVVGKGNWQGTTLAEGLKNWCEDSEMAECKALPTVVSWTPRTTRNAMHFREETLSPLQVFYQLSLLMISLEYLSRINLQDRSGSLDIDKPRAWGFLYGACNGNRGLCGARGALLFSEGHHITFQVGLDR